MSAASFRKSSKRPRQLKRSLIVDGEVVAFKDDQVLPFALLQKRLGRKRPPAALIEEIPVALMIFDLLSVDSRSLLDEPLIERKKIHRNDRVGRSAPHRAIHAVGGTRGTRTVLRAGRAATQ